MIWRSSRKTYRASLVLDIGATPKMFKLPLQQRTKLFRQRIQDCLAALERASPAISDRLTIRFPDRPYSFEAMLTEGHIRAIWDLPELLSLDDLDVDPWPDPEPDENGLLPFTVEVHEHFQEEGRTKKQVHKFTLLVRAKNAKQARKQALEQCRTRTSYLMANGFRLTKSWLTVERVDLDLMVQAKPGSGRSSAMMLGSIDMKEEKIAKVWHPNGLIRSSGIWKQETPTEGMGMDDLLNEKERSLLQAYEGLFHRAPDWAYPIAPPIPFVGKHYKNAGRSGVLIYASAENLGYTWNNDERTFSAWERSILEHDEEWPWFTSHRTHMMRSRIMFARDRGTQVHIEPINNGGLIKVARHIIENINHEGQFSKDAAASFLDEIAVGNPGKFSIKPENGKKAVNSDYASPKHWKKFHEQINYIAADLRILQPAIVLIPATILRSLERSGIWSLVPKPSIVVAMRQVQSRAIRRRYGSRIPNDRASVLPVEYGGWKAPSYADSYIRWIDEQKAKRLDSFELNKEGLIAL